VRLRKWQAAGKEIIHKIKNEEASLEGLGVENFVLKRDSLGQEYEKLNDEVCSLFCLLVACSNFTVGLTGWALVVCSICEFLTGLQLFTASLNILLL
jgi:hypothetical protein